jgi:hypothetical protein
MLNARLVFESLAALAQEVRRSATYPQKCAHRSDWRPKMGRTIAQKPNHLCDCRPNFITMKCGNPGSKQPHTKRFTTASESFILDICSTTTANFTRRKRSVHREPPDKKLPGITSRRTF